MISIKKNIVKRTIVQGIQNGLQEIKEARLENIKKGIPTSNGLSLYNWNFFNLGLKNILEVNNIPFFIAHKNSWKFFLVYDEETKDLYAIMRAERLENIIKSKGDSSEHYINALATLNNCSASEPIEQQLSMLYSDNDNKLIERKLLQQRNLLCSDINLEDTSNFYIVSITEQMGILTNVSAIQIKQGFNIINQESWNEFIGTEYEEENKYNITNPEISTFAPKVTLKAKKRKSEKKSIV